MVYLTQFCLEDQFYAGPEIIADSQAEAERELTFHPLQGIVTGFKIVGRLIEKNKWIQEVK